MMKQATIVVHESSVSRSNLLLTVVYVSYPGHAELRRVRSRRSCRKF